MAADAEDVPSPIDFHDRAQALAWVERTERERPHRPRFFRAIAYELGAHGGRSVLELGSGPGALARHVLDACARVESYTLLDFSEAMLELSRERVAGAEPRTRFLRRDFRSADWTDGLAPVDAVVSLQAVHELRHKRRAARLYGQIAAVLDPEGIALICDHVAAPDADARRSALFMTAAEHLAAFAAGGLGAEVVLEAEGMALYRARLA